MQPRKVVFFTNIPAPYRIDMYNEMHDKGFDFEVWYMRAEVSYRPWKFDKTRMRHRYLINNGFFKMIGSFPFFFNPALVIKAMRTKNLDLIMGLSWNDPDVVILSFLKRIGLLKARLHYWSEANYLTNGARNDNAFKRFLRKFVYNHKDTIQVSSGRMTDITLTEKWGIDVHGTIPLPNTIQEGKYQLTEEWRSIRASNPLPVILITARLIERLKGLINFLSALTNEDLEKCRIVIAGSGKDREMIEQYIADRGISKNVELKGECSVDEMVKLYATSNIFCLPSFADPSPLSVIEALKMELPLIVSDRCGNHFEAVRDGENGYLIDPDNKPQIRQAVLSLLERRNEWEQMGKQSLAIYDSVFRMDVVIDNFINAFNESREVAK